MRERETVRVTLTVSKSYSLIVCPAGSPNARLDKSHRGTLNRQMNKRHLLIKLVIGLLCISALVLGGWRLLRREPATAATLPFETISKTYDKQAAKAAFAEPYRLKRTGRWAESIPLFEEALREYPDHADGYHGLAQSQRELGQTAAGLTGFAVASAGGPRIGPALGG